MRPTRSTQQQSATRRQVLASAAGVAAAFGVTGAARASTAATGASESSAAASATATASAASADVQARARALTRRMSLEEKVGQLFVVEVYGQAADTSHPRNQALYGVATPAEVVAKYQPGGVIYFDARRGPDNVREPRQVAALSNGLQRAALRTGARVPLLVSIDQEGGSVVYRMVEPATQFPGNMALAATRSRKETLRAAEIIGAELAAMGINQNYAPVADVNINPENPIIGVRSFGSDTALCSSLVATAVRGYHEGGVSSAAKHFPGHGDTETDSHTGLPVITHSRAELERIDLPPFRAAIKQGVDTIMSAHIVVPALDASGVPATMSKPIITGLLREELGFEGLIVTDALDMGGATGDFPPDIAPVRALQAGCDQLVLAPKLDVARAAVLDAVRSGKVTESRLDASVTRILAHKLRRGLHPRPFVSETVAARTVGSAAHLSAAASLTDRAVTLVRNEGVLPLSPATARSVLVTGWGATQVKNLVTAVSAYEGQSATGLETGTVPKQAAIDEAAAVARTHDVVLVSSNAAAAGAEKGVAQAALVKALMDTGIPVIVAAVRNPYDIRRFPEVPAYLATYSYGAPALTSLARVLFGTVPPRGKLPVTVPALASPSTTLYGFGHGLSY
ncbi:glycoside hydrolase family 3 protein [Streptomyces daliensis]